MPINKYFLSALSAFIIWGFFSLALKPLHSYASLDILFYRVFIATACLLALNFIFRKSVLVTSLVTFKNFSNKKRSKTIVMTLLGGVLLVLNWFLFIYAVNHVSLQSASFAYIICPIVTTVLAFIILKEKINNCQWFAVLLCLISCIILKFIIKYYLKFYIIVHRYIYGKRKRNNVA